MFFYAFGNDFYPRFAGVFSVCALFRPTDRHHFSTRYWRLDKFGLASLREVSRLRGWRIWQRAYLRHRTLLERIPSASRRAAVDERALSFRTLSHDHRDAAEYCLDAANRIRRNADCLCPRAPKPLERFRVGALPAAAPKIDVTRQVDIIDGLVVVRGHRRSHNLFG